MKCSTNNIRTLFVRATFELRCREYPATLCFAAAIAMIWRRRARYSVDSRSDILHRSTVAVTYYIVFSPDSIARARPVPGAFQHTHRSRNHSKQTALEKLPHTHFVQVGPPPLRGVGVVEVEEHTSWVALCQVGQTFPLYSRARPSRPSWIRVIKWFPIQDRQPCGREHPRWPRRLTAASHVSSD